MKIQAPEINRERLLMPDEAAELLQVSRPVLSKLARRGKLHPVKLNSRTLRYLQAEIMGLAKGGAN
ncbi:MAG: helix-turn-helix domain-containing protein [Verrucomicrobiia bacterium]